MLTDPNYRSAAVGTGEAFDAAQASPEEESDSSNSVLDFPLVAWIALGIVIAAALLLVVIRKRKRQG